jgi:hypothetical protein
VVYVSRLCGKERRRRAVVNGRRAKLSWRGLVFIPLETASV